jgi:hypothetical protein
MRKVGSRLDTLLLRHRNAGERTTTVHHINSNLTGAPEDWWEATNAILGA